MRRPWPPWQPNSARRWTMTSIPPLAITAIYDALKAKTGAATKLAAIGDFDRVLSLDPAGQGRRGAQGPDHPGQGGG